MFFDLHVPWHERIVELQQTLFLLQQLGFNVVALTHTLAGKLPADLSCPIPEILPFSVPTGLRILRRCNLILSDPSQNHRVQQLAKNYDITAIRPTNERSLQQACQSLECDIISIDLAVRFETHFKMKMLAQAIDRGIKLEICYGPCISTGDVNARRNVISNATQLIRATRGRGLILSSEAHRPSSCRGPADVINLAAVWGLGPEKGREAVQKSAASVANAALMKHSSYRGVVDVVCGGDKPIKDSQAGSDKAIGRKRRKLNDDEQTSAKLPLPGIHVSRKEPKQTQRASLPQTETSR